MMTALFHIKHSTVKSTLIFGDWNFPHKETKSTTTSCLMLQFKGKNTLDLIAVSTKKMCLVH